MRRGTVTQKGLACREGLDWSKSVTSSVGGVLGQYGKHVGELDHLIQPIALRVQVGDPAEPAAAGRLACMTSVSLTGTPWH